LLVRREIWDQLGGWDARFGLGVYEDVDFCWRARRAGFQVRYAPDVSLYHHESASRGPDGVHLLNQHTMDNLKRLLEKWGPQDSDEALFYGLETYQRWEKARIKLKQGLQLQDQEDASSALRWFNKAIEIAPDFAEAHLILGQTLGELGQYQEAADHLQKAIAFAPANWDARLLLIDSWIKLGDHDRAADQLEHLLAVFPNHPDLQARKNAMAPKTNGVNGGSRQGAISANAVNTLENLLTSEDLVTTLVEQEEQLDDELLRLVQVNASTARTDGDLDLADGLDALADYVADILKKRQRTVPANGEPQNGYALEQPVAEVASAVPVPAAPSGEASPAGKPSKKRRRRRRKS
jgi:tetratricopeptide (TPR) repeat protein